MGGSGGLRVKAAADGRADGVGERLADVVPAVDGLGRRSAKRLRRDAERQGFEQAFVMGVCREASGLAHEAAGTTGVGGSTHAVVARLSGTTSACRGIRRRNGEWGMGSFAAGFAVG